ncbi:MAG: type 1 glutamine amidotransferase [Pseudomonadota bacterium]
MAKRILILEGNTPDRALRAQEAVGISPAAEYAAALKAEAPTIETVIAAPYFDDFDADAHDLSAYDGMAVTGSGVEWSGADERARPFWEMYERAFAAGTPAFGSCWGVQTAAVALGGDTQAGPNGVEKAVARSVEPVGDHPMTKGRRSAFDVLAMHRDDVTRLPEGAVVTATNAHTAVQAFAYDVGDVSFWGVQYHPEVTLETVAYWLNRPGGAWDKADAGRAKAFARIAEDPAANASLAVKFGVNLDLLDGPYHRTELRNWLRDRVGAI